jgi:hypothetical protein
VDSGKSSLVASIQGILTISPARRCTLRANPRVLCAPLRAVLAQAFVQRQGLQRACSHT